MTVGSQLKQTLACLKGVQGTLRVYSTQSREEEVGNVFNEALGTTSEVISDLENRLKKIE
ncbi:MAG: hypothetical protein CVU88_06195, partial [Firmicutes bacterium HGW-Firmicutes-13]